MLAQLSSHSVLHWLALPTCGTPLALWHKLLWSPAHVLAQQLPLATDDTGVHCWLPCHIPNADLHGCHEC